MAVIPMNSKPTKTCCEWVFNAEKPIDDAVKIAEIIVKTRGNLYAFNCFHDDDFIEHGKLQFVMMIFICTVKRVVYLDYFPDARTLQLACKLAFDE